MERSKNERVRDSEIFTVMFQVQYFAFIKYHFTIMIFAEIFKSSFFINKNDEKGAGIESQ